jgi:hypothetical protein
MIAGFLPFPGISSVNKTLPLSFFSFHRNMYPLSSLSLPAVLWLHRHSDPRHPRLSYRVHEFHYRAMLHRPVGGYHYGQVGPGSLPAAKANSHSSSTKEGSYQISFPPL